MNDIGESVRTILVLLILCVQSDVLAQSASDNSSMTPKPDSIGPSTRTGWVTIESVPAGAEVFDDTSFLGVTPLKKISAREGVHVFKLFYPGVRVWNAQAARDSVVVRAGEEETCNVSFEVQTSKGMFKSEAMSRLPSHNVFTMPTENGELRLRVGYIAGGTMVLTGALSAYLKTNSDNKFNAYVASRDPNLLNRVHQLDTWAGVSLFVSEISFGVLTYLLLSD